MTFRPVQLVDIDVAEPHRRIVTGSTPDGRRYERVQMLLRDRGRPVGVAVVDAPGGVVDPSAMDGAIARADRSPSPARSFADRGPLVTVLIATRDRPASLQRCLASLSRLHYRPFSVLVVDNAVTGEETQRVVRAACHDGLDVTWVREPLAGLSTAHNAGLGLVDTPIVAITDDDVEVDPDWLSAIVDTFARNPDAGAVTGLIYPARLDTVTQARAEGNGLGKGFTERRFDLDDDRPSDRLFPLLVGECGSGANIAIRRSALQELGGFDLALGAGSPSAGGDDLAVMHDLLVRGMAIVYQPAAVVRHHHPDDPRALARQAKGYGRGLGAYLARCALQDPGGATILRQAIPAGVRRLVSQSARVAPGAGRRRGHDMVHLVGLLSGPWAYMAGRRRAERIRPHVGVGLTATTEEDA
jgi:GT2 family glycosyltransferase